MRGELEALVRDTPGLREAISALLERSDRAGGRLPRRVTLRVPPAAADALRRIFTPRAVQAAGEGCIRVDVARFLRDHGPEAEATLTYALYGIAGRAPCDLDAAARSIRRSLERALLELETTAFSETAIAMLRAERVALASDERAKFFVHASEQGVAATVRLASNLVRCLDAIADLSDPVRVQTFAARTVGSSKALRRNGDLFRYLSEALVAHDPRTRRLLEDCGVAPGAARANALEVNGVLFSEAAASVLCFGPIAYAKHGQRFDHVERHAAFGESCRIVLQQLRDAVVVPPRARRITIFENLAPYLDYVDACVAANQRDEIVLCSGGQANFAVVELLRRLAVHALPTRHSGDLDRSGVLIARSLMKRAGARLELCFMDVIAHRRFASRGTPVSEDERTRLAALVRDEHESAPGHALLREILATGTWIEQEAFADDVLADLLER
jgi:hypothetical protein